MKHLRNFAYGHLQILSSYLLDFDILTVTKIIENFQIS